jgi:N-acetylglucosaminyldiphosphoundecaprenol N-acetyl-beta-D-mannosaminyltransferase
VTAGAMRTGAAAASVGHDVVLLGCRVNALTFGQTVAQVDRLVRERIPVQHCVVNASKFVLMRSDPRLRAIIAACPLVNADGQAVVWAGRALGVRIPERVTGVDLFAALLGLAERQGYSVYFLGARSKVVEAVVLRATAIHPRLRVAGHRDGYWDSDDDVVTEIRASAPDILLVGMPSPKKEYWLAENLAALDVPFSMGVGGSFDVFAGYVRRAPVWMQRCGLEWLYRFFQEPRRMWKRYLLGNMTFVWMVAEELVDRRVRSGHASSTRSRGRGER